jgi:archaellin
MSVNSGNLIILFVLTIFLQGCNFSHVSKDFLLGEWVSNKEKTFAAIYSDNKNKLEIDEITNMLGKMTYRFDKIFTSFSNINNPSENSIKFKYIVTNENNNSITIKYDPYIFLIYLNEVTFTKESESCIGLINTNFTIKFTEYFCKKTRETK